MNQLVSLYLYAFDFDLLMMSIASGIGKKMIHPYVQRQKAPNFMPSGRIAL